MEVLHFNLREKRGLDGLVHVHSHGSTRMHGSLIGWRPRKGWLCVCMCNATSIGLDGVTRKSTVLLSPHRFVPPFPRQRSNGREAMSAALTALCKGNRLVRDKARLFVDRVKIWEMQGNARSTQDINASVPAICVWLAAERFVIQAPLTLTRNKSKFECA